MRINILRKEMIIVFWVIILVFSYLSFLHNTIFLSTLYYKSADFFFRYRYSHDKIPALINEIVIVSVDEATLLKLRRRWPLNRGFYEYFLRRICRDGMGPRAVGIDLIFSGKSDRPEEDIALADALRDAGTVIIASYFNEEGKLIPPEAILAKSAKDVGFITSPRDHDLVIRRTYPFILLKDGAIDYSFVLKTFLSANKIDPADVAYDDKSSLLKLSVPGVAAANFSMPVNDKDYTARINYLARPEDFKTISFWEALVFPDSSGIFKDTIVLVGTDIEMNHDVYPTPLGLMSGVGINANVLLSILLNRFPRQLPAGLGSIILFVAGTLVSFATYKMHNLKGLVLSLFLTLSGFYTAVVLISKDTIFDFFGLSVIASVSFVSVAIFKHIVVLIENSRLRKLALTDGLTGLYTFRYFEIKLNGEIKMAAQHNADISLLIFDIDHFKNINDTHGHDLGNEILKKVAMAIKRHVRRGDTVARFGGDEFAVILPRSDINGGCKLAGTVKNVIEKITLRRQDKTIKATVSVGVSSLSSLEKAAAAVLIKSADKALYNAKMSGRNRVSRYDAK